MTSPIQGSGRFTRLRYKRPYGIRDIVKQELNSSNEQTYTGHDGVTESGTERNHDEPDSDSTQFADNTLVLDREIEVEECPAT